MTYTHTELCRLESTESRVETAYCDALFEQLCIDMHERHFEDLVDGGLLMDEADVEIEKLARAEYHALTHERVLA